MRILICGAGQVGYSIARQLSREDNEITVIDYKPELIQKINDNLDCTALLGHASHPSVLKQAGAEDADLLIAVTYSDEVNMVACQIGYSLFNIPTRIARIRNQDYLNPDWSSLYANDQLALNVIISPEIEVARAILRRLHAPGTLDMIPFADDRVRVVAIHCDENCPVLNLPVSIIKQRAPELMMNVIGLVQDGRFVTANKDTVIRSGDSVYFICDSKDMRATMSLFGHDECEARRAIILGGGNIGMFLAQEVEQDQKHDLRVKMIEYDRKRAEFLATHLDKTPILCGSALDREILSEASIEHTETVIAVTNDDETNILASLLAKRFGAERSIALVNNATYAPLLGALGVDVTVNPRETTVSRILEHVRRGKISAVHAIFDGAAEIIEAEVMASSSLAGKTLAQIKLPSGIVFGALLRKDDLIIPDDNTILHEGDHIFILATAKMVRKVEKTFSVSIDFF
ncbi:MAG: Trk system potassium transporter TrkA [Rickettsiales bacterium]|nr:Trk system potassium transporter TrkA [Rickettsiales bacterium]